MAKSSAATVAAYILAMDAARRPALVKLRKMIREALPSSTEMMDWGLATYQKDGKMVTAFASQKNYIAFYPGETAIKAHKKELAGISCGKGCIRYSKPKKIDFDVVRVDAGEHCDAVGSELPPPCKGEALGSMPKPRRRCFWRLSYGKCGVHQRCSARGRSA